jgi:hypothetical protein
LLKIKEKKSVLLEASENERKMADTAAVKTTKTNPRRGAEKLKREKCRIRLLLLPTNIV